MSSQRVPHYAQGESAIAPDVLPLLPSICYTVNETNGGVILVKRGECGYWPCTYQIQADKAREFVNYSNARMGVTRAQESAMQAGSVFGWHIPACDPRKYDAEGKPTSARR